MKQALRTQLHIALDKLIDHAEQGEGEQDLLDIIVQVYKVNDDTREDRWAQYEAEVMIEADGTVQIEDMFVDVKVFNEFGDELSHARNPLD